MSFCYKTFYHFHYILFERIVCSHKPSRLPFALYEYGKDDKNDKFWWKYKGFHVSFQAKPWKFLHMLLIHLNNRRHKKITWWQSICITIVFPLYVLDVLLCINSIVKLYFSFVRSPFFCFHVRYNSHEGYVNIDQHICMHTSTLEAGVEEQNEISKNL